MPFTNRYSDTIRGALTFTGNTAGLSKIAGQNNQGTLGNIGAFTSLNGALSVGDFPLGTTLNIPDNGSSANLVIPAGSTIVYAELIWGGNYFGQDGNDGSTIDISGLINNPVVLTTPLGTTSISPDPATAVNQTQVSNPGTPFDFISSFYERSDDVTALIAPLGPGTHLISVEEIPGLTPANDNLTSQTNHAGWTLAVAYENPSLPYRNLNIWVGGELVRAVNPPVDIPISGFTTPSSGAVNARLLVSAQEGDANIGGDQLQFGPTAGTVVPVSGPNNPIDNFFGSQINDDSGNLDTSGTFGNRNQDPFTLTNISGGRQGWDITNIDASSEVTNNQTSAVLRLSTVGDTYMPNTIGVQIDVQAPIITIDKSVNPIEGIKGDRLLYTIVITNNGTVATNNFNLIDPAPTGTTIDTGTINVINATGPVVDNSTPATIDLELGPVAIGQVVTVQYEVITDNNTPSPVVNDAQAIFEFTPGIGQPPITDETESNLAITDLALVTQTKAVSDAEALVGDIITYTVTIDNTQSAVDLNNVFVFDDLQPGTSYVPSSTSIGGAPPIDADPSIPPGVSVVTVPAGQTLTVTFNVSIDVLPVPNPILNTADVSFTVGTSSATQTTNETEVLVLEPDITAVKSVDKALAQVGDTLTYTTRITNTGNVPLENIIFNDPPPANTTFIPNTVIIDGNPYPGIDPNFPIDFLAIPIIPNIFPLAPGGFVDISYQVTIDSLPVPPEINNTATVDYEVLVDNELRRLSEDSNEVTTDIFEITIVKEVDKVAAEGGDTLTYTSTITTTIPGDYGDPIVFRDLVPPETTLVPGSISVVGSTFTNNSTPTEVILDFGTTFPPNPIVVTFDVIIDNNAVGPILNTSQVDIRQVSTTSNEVQTDIVDPQVSKSVSQINALVGDIITYTVTIDNSTGQAPITNVFVFDTLQPGTSYVNGTTVIGGNPPINSDPTIPPGIPVGIVAAGQIQTVSFDVRIDVFPSPNPILNTADVNYEVDGEQKTLTTNETNVLVQLPDIEIVKSVDKIFAQVGETVTYTSVITNTGTVNIDNIIFNDPPPPNTVYDGNGVIIQGANFPALDPNNPIDVGAANPGLFPLVPGASITISYSVIVTSLPAPPEIQNTASADYLFTVNNEQERRTENSNTVTTQIYELNILKEVDKVAAEGGDTLTYTFTITSNISGNIGVPINFIDNIPAETTFVPGSITVVGVPTFVDNSVPGQVNLDLGNIIPPNPIVITFEVLIDNNAVGPILDTSELEVSGIITPSNQVRTDIVDLNVSKAVSVPEAEVGEIITYTVTIDNSQSNVSIDNVFVFDDLQPGTSYVPGSTVIGANPPIDSDPSIPPGVNVGTVPAGAIVTVSFDVRIDVFPSPNPILNIADVNYEVDGESKSQTTNETEVLVQQPDIEVTKSVDKSFAKLGDPLTYTVVIENTGTVDLQNLIFTDPPPANTVYDGLGVTINGTLYPGLDPNVPIDIGAVNPGLFPVPPGGTITVSFGVIITNVPTPPVITNTAVIDYFYLINGEDRQREESNTVITELFTLNIVKSADPTTVERGDTITFTSVITSDIVGDIGTDIIFRDLIPAGTTLVPGSIDVSGILFFIDNSTPTEVILNLGQVFPPNPIVVTFDVTVDNNASGTILNTSVVETSGVPVESNEVEVDIVILQTTKSVSVPEAEVGEIITYTVTIDNSQSVAPIDNVFVFDNLQPGTTYVPGTTVIDGNPPIDSNPSIPPGISVGTVDAGDIIVVTFDVRIDILPNPNPVLNTANVNYEIEGEPNSQTTNETEVLVQQPDIEVTKSVDKSFAKLGDPLTYTVVIENTGTVDLQNLIFTDPPPANTVYDGLGVTINGTLYPALDPNVPIDIGAVNPGLFPVPPGGTITVSFGVIITNVPTPPVIENTATIDYFYLINGQQRQREESNRVETQLFNLDIVKSVDPTSAERGDTVTFTSTITSDISGDINTDIIFRDIIPAGTTFVPGSITVVGVASFVNNSTPTEIILDLGTVLPPNPIVVSFDVTINNDASGTILNISSVETSGVPVESNEVEVDIVIVEVNKTSSVSEAEVGEIITYTVTIDNSQSEAPIDNVFLFDILQQGTSYVPNSTVIGVNPPIDSNPSIPPGVSIGTINAGDIVVVSFDVSIDEIPNPNPALNTADINYEVEGDPKTQTTNETEVLVFDPAVSLVKEVSDEFVQVGETLIYTSTITNTGTVDLENILFTDFPPANTVYDGLGVIINGTNYPLLDPNVPIDIGAVNPALLPLTPGSSIVVSFGVIVTSVPSPPQIINTSNITYDYIIDGETRSRTEISNEVISQVIDLELIKSVEPQIAERGDIVTFTTTITSNVSGDIGSPIIFRDDLPPGTELIAGSVDVVGVLGFTDLSTPNEVVVDLGTILPPNPIVISFNVRILDNAQSPINNISLIDIRGKETESNEVTLDLVILEVSKAVNDDVVAVGETITYSILIDNTLGTADATNVFLLDLLQPGTSYVANSTSINGGPLQNLDPSIPPGINIGTVPAGSAVLVTFEALVEELPSQNPILNTATLTYNAGEKENSITTNETQVRVVDIDIVKSVNPEFAQVGDRLTYTSIITNTGQVPIENIIFNDPPPSNTVYDNPSFKINNVLYPTLNPSLPIDLSLVAPSLLPLNPGESITIEFSVFVSTLPDIPIIDNISSIEYSYLDGSVLKTDNKDSNLVDTIIREGEITLEKIVDKEVALVGDTLTYTIKVKNTGNIEVENVILTDIVPQDTKFVEGSVIVNGIPNSNLNPENGINLGTIPAPQTYIVSFKVTIENLPVSGEIINNAEASYEVFVNPDGPPVIENTISNDVITIVELLSVVIAKSCEPKCVSIGEEINYIFNIVNNGTVDALNVKLFDKIPAETSFVEGSFIGAQGVVTAKDLIEGVDIGDVAAGESKEVSFSVKVEKVICGLNIINQGSITFEYTLDEGETFESSTSISNECDVTIKATSFKQTFIDKIICIPDEKPDIENIVDVDAKFICTNSKLIDTPVGTSIEGQNLTGKKLVVNGKLCITVTYVAEVETQTVHTAHFEICVCEYIVVPNNIDLDCILKPNAYIEDIFFEKINCRQLFVNIVFMLESGI